MDKFVWCRLGSSPLSVTPFPNHLTVTATISNIMPIYRVFRYTPWMNPSITDSRRGPSPFHAHETIMNICVRIN